MPLRKKALRLLIIEIYPTCANNQLRTSGRCEPCKNSRAQCKTGLCRKANKFAAKENSISLALLTANNFYHNVANFYRIKEEFNYKTGAQIWWKRGRKSSIRYKLYPRCTHIFNCHRNHLVRYARQGVD